MLNCNETLTLQAIKMSAGMTNRRIKSSTINPECRSRRDSGTAQPYFTVVEFFPVPTRNILPRYTTGARTAYSKEKIQMRMIAPYKTSRFESLFCKGNTKALNLSIAKVEIEKTLAALAMYSV